MNQNQPMSAGAEPEAAGEGTEATAGGTVAAARVEGAGAARLLRPDRLQMVFESTCLDEQLDPEHRARLVWDFVQGSDTTELERRVRSREGRPGAPAIDPRVLLALWLLATLDNVGSAREVDRLCREHVAYRWLCGRVSVNYHTLSDFRAGLGEFLSGLLTRMIASLVQAGVVDPSTIHGDGTKTRASAGTSSFRRKASLQGLLEQARQHVDRVAAEADDQTLSSRQRAARKRAADERLARVQAALKVMPELEQIKQKQGGRAAAKVEPRASTTDADARRMKMADGGTRPAYNVQFAADAKGRAIVGVLLTTQGSDYGLSRELREDVEKRTGAKVREQIFDGGYVSKDVIEKDETDGVACIMPLPKGKDGEPCTGHKRDGPGVTQWRARMQTEEAKQKLRQRPGIIETPNAELKTYRALDRVLVRGKTRVTAVVLLAAVTYNLLHFSSVLT